MVESEIIQWVNNKLAEGKKDISISSFQDKVGEYIQTLTSNMIKIFSAK